MLKILYCFQYFIMLGDEIFNIKNFGKNLHLRLVEKKKSEKVALQNPCNPNLYKI